VNGRFVVRITFLIVFTCAIYLPRTFTLSSFT
jgi:hypothetical protein